jgi:hypothetical protein
MVGLMARSYSPLTQLTTANLVVGGIAVLPQLLWNVEDLSFFVLLGSGPACLVAGVGLWKRRRWGRVLTLTLGAVVAAAAVVAGALAGLGVLRATQTRDFFLPACFVVYGVAAYVILWDGTFATEAT